MSLSECADDWRSEGLGTRVKSRSKLETESGYGLFPAQGGRVVRFTSNYSVERVSRY